LIMARVLLIDDDQSNLEFMRRLPPFDRHEFAWVPDGEQGPAPVRQLRSAIRRCPGRVRP